MSETPNAGADELRATQALLRMAQQHAHRTDAERAEMEARLYTQKADTASAHARAARSYAESVAANAAVAEVRRRCDTAISDSVRVQAVKQDILSAIDSVMESTTFPGDAAWGTVWLHGNWRYLTKNMTTPEREHAADAVARWSAALHADDDDLEEGEPDGLRWWRDDR